MGVYIIETKICNKCNIEKPIDQFGKKNNKYLSRCKQCINNYMKEYCLKNKEYKKTNNKKYRENHKEKIKEITKNWRENNKIHKKEIDKQYYENNIDKIKEYNKSYYKKNKKKLLEKAKIYKNKKRKEDELFKIKGQIRHMINISFNKKGLNKSKHTEEIIGMPIKDFYNYLLQTFKDNYGYEYDGKEKIHIDHIKPLKYAKTKEEVIKLCNYKNLQLLKAKDNLQKSSKINYKLEGVRNV